MNHIEVQSDYLDFYKFTLEQMGEAVLWLDEKGKIIYSNNAARLLNGYTRHELEMMYLHDLDSSLTRSNLPTLMQTIQKTTHWQLITSLRKKNGTIYTAQITAYAFVCEEQTYICATCKNISQNIEYTKKITKLSQELQKSVDEKKTFLREIHHRVKNNMEIIASLLNMQYRRSKDKNIKYILQQSVSRINTMALVHEFLYLGENLSYINVKDYISRLIEDIQELYLSNNTDLDVDLNIDRLVLSTNRCIQVGMILHELCVNSLKYAFKENRKNLLCIHIKDQKDQDENIHLKIRDNGDGMGDIASVYKNDSIGMQLIHSIVTDQLDGTVEFVNNKGLECNIFFAKKEIV